MKVRHGLLVTAVCLLSILVSPASGAGPAPTDENLSLAAERGDADAQYRFARALLTGEGAAPNLGESLQWMKRAAAQGHADALGGVGYFYAKGIAVPQDDRAAAEWFTKGARKGSAKAQLNLGLALARGKGLPKDETEGLRWIERAAESGLSDALYANGETYFWGEFGRTVDYAKAHALFQRAAELGNLNAQINLGVSLREGLGTSRDEQAAIGWFRLAAMQGNAKAESLLGHTLGLESQERSTRLEALKWVMLAADQGEITAIKSLEELLPNLTPADKDEARQFAATFQPAVPDRFP